MSDAEENYEEASGSEAEEENAGPTMADLMAGNVGDEEEDGSFEGGDDEEESDFVSGDEDEEEDEGADDAAGAAPAAEPHGTKRSRSDDEASEDGQKAARTGHAANSGSSEEDASEEDAEEEDE